MEKKAKENHKAIKLVLAGRIACFTKTCSTKLSYLHLIDHLRRKDVQSLSGGKHMRNEYFS